MLIDDPLGPADIDVSIETDAPEAVRMVNGALEMDTADGGVVIDFNPTKQPEDDDTGFDDNLAMEMEQSALDELAGDLLEGIKADDDSRAEWLATREAGIDLLGLKIEKPSDEPGGSGNISKVRPPLLLDAVLRSQATAAAELLPASGPVKVRNDGIQTLENDEQAEVLERGMNHYLTVTAKEYYPDTRRGLFWSSFGGCVFKKVYNCPIKRRPVSETVDAKDVIVSNATTDLASAVRVTHQINMRPSTMKRMQKLEVYRDVELSQPIAETNAVQRKEDSVAGVEPNRDRPEDQTYTVYECYTELDLDEFAPKQFKGDGIALPYRVTLEKDSRVVLDIRRNWDEDDEQCLPKRFLVKYPFVEAMGLYGIGLLQILGNTVTALQGAWRLLLDSGMINNFPGGLIDSAATKQKSNNVAIPVGGLAPIQLAGRDIRAVAMAMPGKPLDPSFLQFIKQIEETAQRLGGSAEIPVGEGRADVPVGTALAAIEQATKIISEVHKGLHAAQAEEFQLLVDRIREDPEAFLRGNKECPWDAERLLEALKNCSIVPVADPNTPSHLHRLMKVSGLKQIGAGNQNMDQDEIDKEALKVLGFEDAERFFKPPQPAGQPDPAMIMAEATSKTANAKLIEVQQKPLLKQLDLAGKAADTKSKERVEAMKVAATVAIHPETAPLVQRTIQSNTPR